MKYELIFSFESMLLIEKHDIVGAIYGELDGLLSDDLDLKKLAKFKKIGHVSLEIGFKEKAYVGTFIIPSNLTLTETATIGAAIETIKSVGASLVKFNIKEIKDLRLEKKEYIFNRTKELLEKNKENIVSQKNVVAKINESKIKYIPGTHIIIGPKFESSDTGFVVEGRRDLLNFISMGMENVISIGGANINSSLNEYIKNKKIICLFDSDRGGKLLLQKLIDLKIEIDYVAFAPDGTAIEEIQQKSLLKSLNSKITLKEYIAKSKNE